MAVRRPALAVLLAFAGRAEALLRAASSGAADGLDTIHVAYQSDADGFVELLPSMLSLSRNLRAPETCTIHILVPKADISKAWELMECFRRELEDLPAAPTVVLHDAASRIGNWANYESRLQQKSWLLYSYFYLPAILPGVRRVLYLNTDTIVRHDVATLYRTPLRSSTGAVLEPGFDKKQGRWVSNYTINAGVLLMDLDKWRALGITARLEHWANLTRSLMDQELVSFVLKDRLGFDPLDRAWNLAGLGAALRHYPLGEEEAAHILHWSYKHKPWRCHDQDMASEFFRYTPRSRCDAWPLRHAREAFAGAAPCPSRKAGEG